MSGVLLVSCSDDRQMPDGSLTFSVFCPPMQNGREVTRGIFDDPVSEKLAADYPQQITVVPSEGSSYVISMDGDNDNDGFVAYHVSSSEQMDSDVAGKSFTAYAPMQWDVIPDVSSDEYLIATGDGSYYFDRSKSHLFFTMSHVQAMLRFCFKVSEKYSRIRQVKVKDVKVNSVDTRLRSAGGFLLMKESSCESVCFVNPAVIRKDGKFTLSCTYDIYDKDEVGVEHLVRDDETATNDITVGKSGSSIASIQAGRYYTFNITINPDSLHVLSDHDNKHMIVE